MQVLVGRLIRVLAGGSAAAALEVENAVLRHQLRVLGRSVKRPKLRRRAYLAHYNAERPHRSLELVAPAGQPPVARGSPPAAIRRHDVLGGLIHEYAAAA
jgi:hypothetical protein